MVLEPRSRAPNGSRTGHARRSRTRSSRCAKSSTDAGSRRRPGHDRVPPASRLDLEAVPSESTIWRVLSRRGFIVAGPSKAPKHAATRASRPNGPTSAGRSTTPRWALADGTEVKIINVIDDHSRVAVALGRGARPAPAMAAFDDLQAGRGPLGLARAVPLRQRQSVPPRPGRRPRRLGIGAGHSRPYHPQTCGKVERFHQTLKRYLAAKTRAETLAELQDPARRVPRALQPPPPPPRPQPTATPPTSGKTHPRADPPTGPSAPAPRSTTARVAANGTVNIGRRYAHQPRRRPPRPTRHRHHHRPQLPRLHRRPTIRALTLDPTRRHQPLYNRPGRPRQYREECPATCSEGCAREIDSIATSGLRTPVRQGRWGCGLRAPHRSIRPSHPGDRRRSPGRGRAPSRRPSARRSRRPRARRTWPPRPTRSLGPTSRRAAASGLQQRLALALAGLGEGRVERRRGGSGYDGRWWRRSAPPRRRCRRAAAPSRSMPACSSRRCITASRSPRSLVKWR